MLKKTIDLAAAITGLANIVKRFGEDYTPQSQGAGTCIYFHEKDGALVPVCIVGQFFSDLGILRAAATPGDPDLGQYGSCHIDSGMWNDAEVMGVKFDTEAKKFLKRAQSEQDSGSTWGQALRTAFDSTKRMAFDASSAEVEAKFNALGYLLPQVEEPLAPWERELLGSE